MNTLLRNVAIVLAAALAAVGCSSDQTTRDETGAIVEEGDLGVFAVQEGDCINIPSATNEISTFTGVACTEPHDGQVFAAFDYEADAFPGSATLQAAADEGCVERFETFIGVAYVESIYYMQTFIPTEDGWDTIDDREILCVVVPESGSEQLTQDLEGIGE